MKVRSTSERYLTAIAALFTITISGIAVGSVQATDAKTESQSSLATFDGEVIDLSAGWGEAHACAITEYGNYCYRTVEELRANHDGVEPTTNRATVAPRASCASAVELYNGAGYGSTSLFLYTRGVVLNLSTWSFSGVTSSYKIGACGAQFRDAANLNYPGTTTAGTQSPGMSSGWDNRIAKVVIS